jgi:hypothetical protein
MSNRDEALETLSLILTSTILGYEPEDPAEISPEDRR